MNEFKRTGNSKAALAVGSIQSEWISTEMYGVIKMLHGKDPEIIVVGSAGLAISGLLKRPVQDLDILVNKDYYHQPGGFFETHRDFTREKPSMRFFLDDMEVNAFCLNFGKIKVDVFYFPNPKFEPKYSERGDMGTVIRIGDPMVAIKAKLAFIKKYPQSKEWGKHVQDLKDMNVDPSHITSAILMSKDEFMN